MKKVKIVIDGQRYIGTIELEEEEERLTIPELEFGSIYYLCEWHVKNHFGVPVVSDHQTFSNSSHGTVSFPLQFMGDFFVSLKVPSRMYFGEPRDARICGEHVYPVVQLKGFVKLGGKANDNFNGHF